MKRYSFLAVAFLAAFAIVPQAQMRVVPVDEEQGHVALGLALRHLANTGIFMMATAHPDDENNGLLVMLNRGQGYRTALATATRGNGGQNEIGPELFEALGVLRTEELAALHRFDGAEQYFTRAVDFGYSFDLDETLEKWGRDEIIGDYVRLIRTIRPDVVSAMSPTALGPGQHRITRSRRSCRAKPTSWPATRRSIQSRSRKVCARGSRGSSMSRSAARAAATRRRAGACAGLIWRCTIRCSARRIRRSAPKRAACTSARGRRSCSRCPGLRRPRFQLAESTIPGQMDRDEATLFDGVDTSIAGLAKFAGARPPKDLVDGLTVMAAAVQTAQKKFDGDGDGAVLTPLLDGLHAVRVLRCLLRAMPIDEAARFEIDFRLRQKEREFQQATLVAAGVRVEALADDGVVVPGQPVKVSVIVANHGPTEVTVKQVKFDGLEGDAACTLTAPVAGGGGGGGGAGAPAARAPAPTISSLKNGQVGRCDPTLMIPADARVSEPYWHRPGDAGRYTFDADAPFGLPFRPTPFYVQVTLAFPTRAGNEEVFDGLPLQYRYEGDIFSGEKRMDLLVVPAFSVSVSPEIAMIPAASVRVASAAAAPRPDARPRRAKCA